MPSGLAASEGGSLLFICFTVDRQLKFASLSAYLGVDCVYISKKGVRRIGAVIVCGIKGKAYISRNDVVSGILRNSDKIVELLKQRAVFLQGISAIASRFAVADFADGPRSATSSFE